VAADDDAEAAFDSGEGAGALEGGCCGGAGHGRTSTSGAGAGGASHASDAAAQGQPPEVGVEAAVLLRRWREPSLTVHGVTCSAANESIIPRAATAFLSVRTVPHMTSAATFALIAAHLRAAFEARCSVNTLSVAMTAHAAWWLQSPAAPHYQVAARAVLRHWGRAPVFVREGGTVRVTTFLEKTLRAPALHLPIGQSSDSPHLPNERLRLLNLVTGMRVLESTLLEFAGIHDAAAATVHQPTDAR
jgi:acetylornithine deacetylase/succinyl-diaminopimelate desuccinylase-like protein